MFRLHKDLAFHPQGPVLSTESCLPGIHGAPLRTWDMAHSSTLPSRSLGSSHCSVSALATIIFHQSLAQFHHVIQVGLEHESLQPWLTDTPSSASFRCVIAAPLENHACPLCWLLHFPIATALPWASYNLLCVPNKMTSPCMQGPGSTLIGGGGCGGILFF
jgi:hypothetical protein